MEFGGGEKVIDPNDGGGKRVTPKEESLLAKLLGARKKGQKKLKPDEIQTTIEANLELKPVGRSVSNPIGKN